MATAGDISASEASSSGTLSSSFTAADIIEAFLHLQQQRNLSYTEFEEAFCAHQKGDVDFTTYRSRAAIVTKKFQLLSADASDLRSRLVELGRQDLASMLAESQDLEREKFECVVGYQLARTTDAPPPAGVTDKAEDIRAQKRLMLAAAQRVDDQNRALRLELD